MCKTFEMRSKSSDELYQTVYRVGRRVYCVQTSWISLVQVFVNIGIINLCCRSHKVLVSARYCFGVRKVRAIRLLLSSAPLMANYLCYDSTNARLQAARRVTHDTDYNIRYIDWSGQDTHTCSIVCGALLFGSTF